MSNIRSPMDRRVRRTREALYSALLSLVVRKGYDATTIKDILDEADVGRSTFYLHFAGKEALLDFGIVRLSEYLDAAVAGQPPGEFAFLPPLLAHVRSHAGLYAALLQGGGSAQVTTSLRAVITRQVERELVAIGLAANHVGTTLLAGGLVAALHDWARHPDSRAGDHLVDSVRAMALSLASSPNRHVTAP